MPHILGAIEALVWHHAEWASSHSPELWTATGMHAVPLGRVVVLRGTAIVGLGLCSEGTEGDEGACLELASSSKHRLAAFHNAP